MADPAKQIIKAAKQLAELRDRKEELEEQLKEVNKAKGKLETQTLPKLMEDAEVDKITIEGIGTLYTQQMVRATIYASERDEVYEWFRENGHADLVKETIYNQTLTAWIKEQLEEGNEVPAFLNHELLEVARIRRR